MIFAETVKARVEAIKEAIEDRSIRVDSVYEIGERVFSVHITAKESNRIAFIFRVNPEHKSATLYIDTASMESKGNRAIAQVIIQRINKAARS